MDALQMMAFILYILGNITIATLKVKGYVKMIGYFSLMLVGFLAVNSMTLGETAYLVIALPPAVLFLGDMIARR